MSQVLRRAQWSYAEYRHFWSRHERKRTAPISPLARLSLRMKGFHAHNHALYNLAQNDVSEYLSDVARIRMRRCNMSKNPRASYPVALNNKFFYSAIMSHVFRVPEVYAFIDTGRVHPTTPRWGDLWAGGSLRGAVEGSGGCLVLKPLTGAEGKGVHFLRSAPDGSGLLLDGAPISEADARARIGKFDEYLVTEYIRQGAFAASLNPGTTNTMRAITLIDPASGEPFMAACVQRIGSSKSAPVDNWTQGGFSANIDMETGELSRATSFPYGRSGVEWFTHHTETGAPIAGQRVPNWTELRDSVLRAAGMLPFFKCLAWDLVATDDGVCSLEGSSSSDVQLIQVHRPLLRDKRVRAFFEHYKIL